MQKWGVGLNLNCNLYRHSLRPPPQYPNVIFQNQRYLITLSSEFWRNVLRYRDLLICDRIW